ncbi:hypothetical protein U9M48_037053 [Paspalum notatum var. saurae]|uniref:Trichome birefringence-like N-terminal domain-containing protein n=1 Tax=Paspalum notatum var. saurae TaxID=547442 RepID=A0AAQ3X8V6_PASNO
MVLCFKLLFGPTAAVFLSAVVILSCFTNAPYLQLSLTTTTTNAPSHRLVVAAPSPPAPAPLPKCDIFWGEWVPDPDSPAYTNETCAFIQDHQNCMFYGRPDLGFLKWRWKPHGCHLPRFDPHAFLRLLSNRTLAFVGDSLARNHMQSLLCLLSKVASPKDVSVTDKTDPNKILHYEAHNFTIYLFWSPFLVRSEELAGRPGVFRLHLDEPDAGWLAAAPRVDIALLSAANWFTRQSYLYRRGRLVGGVYVPLNSTTHRLTTPRHSHRAALRTALRALAAARFRGKVVMRTLSPMSHFEGGAYNDGGDCRRTRPFGANETKPMRGVEREFYTSQMKEFRKAAAAGGMDVVVMDVTAAMRMRPDGHPSRYGHWPDEKRAMYNDCIHWCLPGPVDVWNDMLLHLLSDQSI